MNPIKHFAISILAAVALVTLSACRNSAPESTSSTSTSSPDSQVPIAGTPRADAQALVVQACNSYDSFYHKAESKYGSYSFDGANPEKFYAMVKPVWSPLAQAALEDQRWSQALESFNLFFKSDSGDGSDGSYSQAVANFESACQIARSASRVNLDR